MSGGGDPCRLGEDVIPISGVRAVRSHGGVPPTDRRYVDSIERGRVEGHSRVPSRVPYAAGPDRTVDPRSDFRAADGRGPPRGFDYSAYPRRDIDDGSGQGGARADSSYEHGRVAPNFRDDDYGYRRNCVGDATDRYGSRRYDDSKCQREHGFNSSRPDMAHTGSRNAPYEGRYASGEDDAAFSRGRRTKRPKWHNDVSFEGRRVGKKFFKPQRPPEAPLDLWCRVCNRHFQDTNSKLSHDKSKKHRKAVEEAREREEHDFESEPEPDVQEEEAPQTHIVETNLATNDRVSKMLESGAHSKAPKPFRDWVNRSIAAAHARGDPALVAAVCKEVAEELYMQNERSTIHLTNWATRENASGLLYLGAAPMVVKIPLFDSKEATTGGVRGEAGHDEDFAVGMDASKHQHVSSQLEQGQLGAAISSFGPQLAPLGGSALPPDALQPHLDSSWSGRDFSRHLPCEGAPDGTNGLHTMDQTRSVGGEDPIVSALNSHEGSSARTHDLSSGNRREDEPGYRCRPAPPDAASVGVRRRNSVFIPSSTAGKRVRAACVPLDPSIRDALAVVYERDYVVPRIPGESGTVGNAEVDVSGRVSVASLHGELDGLYREFENGYSYAEFSVKLQSLVAQLEAREKPFTNALRRAYELQVEAALLQDNFGDIVCPCARLMDVYRSMRDVVIRPRDKFIAYYCISLLLKSSAPNNLASKHQDREYHALPGLLAKCLAAGPRGVLTGHAVSVVTAALGGHWTKFFRLRAEGLGHAEVGSGLEIATDAYVDVVRSMALHAIFFSMDHPATVPLQKVMEELKWFLTLRDRGSKLWQLKEAREFISRAGCQLQALPGDVPEDGSSEVFLCQGEKQQLGHNLKVVHGAVEPDLIREYRCALQRRRIP